MMVFLEIGSWVAEGESILVGGEASIPMTDIAKKRWLFGFTAEGWRITFPSGADKEWAYRGRRWTGGRRKRILFDGEESGFDEGLTRVGPPSGLSEFGYGDRRVRHFWVDLRVDLRQILQVSASSAAILFWVSMPGLTSRSDRRGT